MRTGEEQAQRRLLLPTLAGKGRAARCADRLVGSGGLGARFSHGNLAIDIDAESVGRAS